MQLEARIKKRLNQWVVGWLWLWLWCVLHVRLICQWIMDLETNHTILPVHSDEESCASLAVLLGVDI